MATTVVNICNLALSRIGEEASISSIERPGDDIHAQICARMYPMALGTLLDKHNWAFATKRATMAKLANFDASPWQYSYAFPNDCRRIIDLAPQEPEVRETIPVRNLPPLFSRKPKAVEFEVVNAGGTIAVLTNCENPTARYIIKNPPPSFFTDSFVDALAWLLASHLSGQAVRGESGFNYAGYCYKYFLMAYDVAAKQDASQTRRYARYVPENIRSRQ